MYYEGIGTIQNYNKAFYWMKSAADSGFVFAYDGLGDYYKMGIGCEVNYDEATYWYKKAIECGYEVSKKKLGI